MSDQSDVMKVLEANSKALGRVSDAQAQIRDRMLAVEQELAKKGFHSGGDYGGSSNELADLITKSAGAQAFNQQSTPSFSVQVPARLLAKNTIINATGQNQPLVASDRAESRGIVFSPQQRLTIRGLFAAVPTASNLIERASEATYTSNARPQGDVSPGGIEGELKAESSMTFTITSTAVITLAHWIAASRQILSDAPLLQMHLTNRLLYGLALKEEAEMLTGDGNDGDMSGIVTNASAFSYGATNQTRLDTLAYAANQLAVANYEPSGFIMHPTDWIACQLEKDANGNYILGSPGAQTSPMAWGLPVVPTPSMTLGKFVCIDAARYGYIADREDATVRISENVSDQFIRNLITLLAEKRTALITELGGAAVYGNLATPG